jgi:hypothetical protein
MAFNKDIISENQFESPFDLVKEGRWTYDKMHEYGRIAARDINGDGRMTLEDDLWGINYTGDSIFGIINSSGVRLVEFDSSGMPEITVNNQINLDRLIKIFDTMRDASYSVDTLFSPLAGSVGNFRDIELFGDGRALFVAAGVHNIAGHDGFNLRSTDVDFGIIPYPKWDETVPDYTPFTAGGFHPVLTVPQTNRNLEHTGIILEAMAYEGMKGLRPEFYESLLKTKTARDEESEEMIDFIFDNIQYDVGNMFNFGDMLRTFGYDISQNQNMQIASQIERNMGRWQRAIDAVINEIGKN